MLATAFQFTSEPAASHIANLVSLVIPLKCVKLEHPGSEFHGSMQSLCKVLEHADCDSFVLSHLAGSRLRSYLVESAWQVVVIEIMATCCA